MSTVDVIVPCYRYAHFLRGCVESILTQTGVDVRVLILDDASPDNTPEVGADLTREDRRVTYVRHTTNKGHIATYNEGIAWTSGDYLLLLSADDYLLPGALQRATALLDGHTEMGFAFGRAIERYADGREILTKQLPHASGNSSTTVLQGRRFIEHCWPNNIVPTPTAVVRTTLQKTVGGYRPDLPHAGDLEMWLRLAAHAPVGFIDARQAVYRKHGNNMSEAYYRQAWLPDVEQRKQVIVSFMASCGPMLSDADQVRFRMMRELSRNTIGLASKAFNDGEFYLSRRLEDAAIEIFPNVKKTISWWKLACKRRVGPSIWKTVKPAVDKFRHYMDR